MAAVSLDVIEEATAAYRSNESVLGIVLVGSAARPYGDVLSDCDVEVVLTDEAYERLGPESRLTKLEEGGIEFLHLAQSQFEAKKTSTVDNDHWPYEECVILFDRGNYVASEIELIAMLPDDVRRARVKLHYFEFRLFANKVDRLLSRASELNLRLGAGYAVSAAIRLLFVLDGRWPPIPTWASHNLASLPSATPTLQQLLSTLVREPSARVAQALIDEIDRVVAPQLPEYTHVKSRLVGDVTAPEFRKIWEGYTHL